MVFVVIQGTQFEILKCIQKLLILLTMSIL